VAVDLVDAILIQGSECCPVAFDCLLDQIAL